MTDVLIVVLTALSTFAAIWGTIIYPRAKEKRRLESEELKKQAERDEDIDGIVSASGEVVTPRLVNRVHAIETAMYRVTAGQSLLEKRMDEANGTTKRIEDMVRTLVEKS